MCLDEGQRTYRTSRTKVSPVEKSLTAPYHGLALEGFYEYLTDSEAKFSTMTYYARFCSVVQSSGTGKSRMIMQMADKDVIVLYLNLRAIGDSGYPPRDAVPAAVLVENLLKSEREYRARCCAFFAAIFTFWQNTLKAP
ncbi:hypothetical protein F5I97DRAFT_64875 [Phlebopus sp. FC_14]|nr:hypothetical protein F5I97DRAFT_64875 [Phlebopus sp. FC_14]